MENKIKASDFMIGDFVYAKTKNGKKIARVCWVIDNFVAAEATDGSQYTGKQFDGVFSCIEPIPLTSEILKKNGLEYEDDGNDAIVFLCCDIFWARLCVGDTFWQVGIHSEDRLDAVVCNVKYTHQLQHALRLTGVGKEIVV